MANKKNKKKVQQAAPKASNKAATDSKVEAKKAVAKKADKTASKKSTKAAKVKKDNKKPGLFTRIKKYFGSVRSEMKRVTWPNKKELVNYSLVVCASLIVVGVVIALLDAGFSEGLALFAGLRG